MSEYPLEVKGLMPVLSIQAAVQRYNAIVEFARTVMKPDKDYGVIPGTGNKPTLLKPGAEKLCSLFGLVDQFVPLNNIFDFDKGIFYFQYRCELYRDGILAASGIGSCNSRESKYRYRWITSETKPEKAEADKLKAQGIGRWRKEGDTWKWQNRAENTEPFDLINTIDKMAQKRAFIAATLIATNASEFFTQDIEDMEIIEGQFVETQASIPSEELFPSATEPDKKEEKDEPSNGKADTDAIYQAVVDALLSENIHSAKTTLTNYCQTGFDTPEKAVAWFRQYRGARDQDKTPKEAAKAANYEIKQAAKLANNGEPAEAIRPGSPK